ncbi:unnamed protein product [Miscanthus lutarioriparius]|uniref:Uncharacterized protein n=1 Tax=Miscanthus lutarioriparius TaxID=422564 RepID=A0A811Q2T3_9POAL|nr:unnamed protein product [Miscanthus lutarioriparius]
MVTMEFSGAYKKATAALDEAARARLRGPFIGDIAPSSGRADADDDLMDLVDEFYNGYGEHGTDGGGVTKDAVASRTTEWNETVRLTLAEAAADAAAVRIRAEAERIVRGAGPAVAGGGGTRKHLVERLRARGYDASLCRSSWERTSSIAAPGTYEYVDVTLGSPPLPSRYIVEVNVAAKFEIARPSTECQDLLSSLPPVLVARPGALTELAASLCAAAAESIRGAGMHVPPWRRAPYVQAKWSAQFERMETAATEPRPEGGPRAAVHARRPSVGKNCGMEMGRRQGAMGREALVSVRPLFRGL